MTQEARNHVSPSVSIIVRMFSLMKRDFDLMTVLNWQNFQGSVLPTKQERATICDLPYTETVFLADAAKGAIQTLTPPFILLRRISIELSLRPNRESFTFDLLSQGRCEKLTQSKIVPWNIISESKSEHISSFTGYLYDSSCERSMFVWAKVATNF